MLLHSFGKLKNYKTNKMRPTPLPNSALLYDWHVVGDTYEDFTDEDEIEVEETREDKDDIQALPEEEDYYYLEELNGEISSDNAITSLFGFDPYAQIDRSVEGEDIEMLQDIKIRLESMRAAIKAKKESGSVEDHELGFNQKLKELEKELKEKMNWVGKLKKYREEGHNNAGMQRLWERFGNFFGYSPSTNEEVQTESLQVQSREERRSDKETSSQISLVDIMSTSSEEECLSNQDHVKDEDTLTTRVENKGGTRVGIDISVLCKHPGERESTDTLEGSV
jgi:hypothetical protein